MKTKEEIKRIITEHYGLKTLEEYKVWLKNWRARGGGATKEEVELLSPDNINCRDFWQVAGELFGVDPICNEADGAVYRNEMEANRLNMTIADSTGVMTIPRRYSHLALKVLEYGPGLGCFKNYVEVNTQFYYTGFDVNPRINGVAPTTEQGYIPQEFVEKHAGTYTIIYSSNVLQHMSPKQKTGFFDAASKLLCKGGVLTFNQSCCYDGTFTEDKRPHMVLYGQFIPVPTVKEIVDELRPNFDLVSHQTSGSLSGFVFYKK